VDTTFAILQEIYLMLPQPGLDEFVPWKVFTQLYVAVTCRLKLLQTVPTCKSSNSPVENPGQTLN